MSQPLVSEKKSNFFELQIKKIKKHKAILWFIIPAAMFTLIFSYIPMFGVLFAFKTEEFDSALKHNANVLGALNASNWTFETIKSIINPEFLSSFKNSIIINLIKLLLVFPISIIIAIQLAELKNQRLSKLILIIICIPNFLSWTVCIKTWYNFLDPDTGLLGRILSKTTNGEALYSVETWFRPLFIFLGAWKGCGWGSILYYAAITSIDKTYYEAATIDGANRVQKAFYLTIPSIGGTIALMLVMTISGFASVGLEQMILMLSNSTFYDAEKSLDLYIYDISIGNGAGVSYVRAAAVGVFNGALSLTLMLIGNKITTKTLNRGLW